MQLGRDWSLQLHSRLDSITGLSTSKPNKYHDLNAWLAGELSLARVRTCHLSTLSQMWTPRLGQALMGFPDMIVLLSHQPLETRTTQGTYLDRLCKTIQYAGRIQVALACTGHEGSWQVDFVAGPRLGDLSGRVAAACESAVHVLVDVTPFTAR